MTTTMDRVADTLRQRVPPLTALPLPNAINRRLLTRTWPTRELAPAPADSGLAPVLGDAGPPLVGHSLLMMRYGAEFSLRRYERYGPVSWSRAFGHRIVAVSGPDATQEVLVNKNKNFSQQGWEFFIDRFFRRGLMLLDFDEHHTHRRIMQQAFTRDRLTSYVDQLAPTVRGGVDSWTAHPNLRLYDALKQLTLDVATRVFMGTHSGAEAHTVNRAFVATVRAATALIRRPVPGGRFKAGLDGRRLLENYFATHLPAKKATDSGDLFSALAQARTPDGERFTDADVINHMIFLMMAAHDTSTIATTAAAYYLARHPDWQERARQESRALGDDLPDADALDRLETLDLVVKEALRVLPPVPSLPRKTMADTEVLGHYIPAGTMVSVTPVINHFDPACWTAPHTFDPERFTEARREDKSHRYAWIPFGGGVHKCIGLHFGMYEVKALLHEMLRRYRWSVPSGYRVRWDYVSLPVPVDGLPVRLRPV